MSIEISTKIESIKEIVKKNHKVIIVGGGFGGVKTALQLSKTPGIDVTLVSDKDHFIYYPSLYATATGSSQLQSVVPLDEIIGSHNIRLIVDEVVGLDTIRKHVVGRKKQYDYDSVVFALGVVTTYFGIKGLDTYSYSIKSAHEVKRFKQHLHDELTADRHLDKNYVVVGAGPTGVELSASLVTYLAHIADKHKVKHSRIRLDLVEAAPRVLPRMSEQASELVAKRLKKLGVRVMTGQTVEAQDDDSIIVSGKDIPSETVVWTSGVSNHPFFKEHADIFSLAKNGRVEVDEHLSVQKDIYVIGDNAATPFTGLAQTALHDALFVAKVIKANVTRNPLPKYKARKPPVVVPVGDNWAIFEWGPLRLTGRLASWIRVAADFIGHNDVLPLGHALGSWRAEWIREESCPTCHKD